MREFMFDADAAPRARALCAALLALSACGAVLFAAAAQADEIMPQTYICGGRHVALPLTYIITPDNAYAVMQAEGKQISMRRRAVPAAETKTGGAGAPEQKSYYYVSLDKQNGYRWYPDGDSGRLTFLGSDSSAKEETVYAACRLRQS